MELLEIARKHLHLLQDERDNITKELNSLPNPEVVTKPSDTTTLVVEPVKTDDGVKLESKMVEAPAVTLVNDPHKEKRQALMEKDKELAALCEEIKKAIKTATWPKKIAQVFSMGSVSGNFDAAIASGKLTTDTITSRLKPTVEYFERHNLGGKLSDTLFGRPLFRGYDGKFYTIDIDAFIVEANDEFAKMILTDDCSYKPGELKALLASDPKTMALEEKKRRREDGTGRPRIRLRPGAPALRETLLGTGEIRPVHEDEEEEEDEPDEEDMENTDEDEQEETDGAIREIVDVPGEVIEGFDPAQGTEQVGTAAAPAQPVEATTAPLRTILINPYYTANWTTTGGWGISGQ